MIIVSYGVAKSSSSYAFQLIDAACNRRFESTLEYKKYRREVLHTESLDDIYSDLAAIFSGITQRPKMPVSFKTHDFFTIEQRPQLKAAKQFRPFFRSGRAICIGTYRDPRDVCLSFLDHGDRDRREGRHHNHMTKMFTLEDTVAATKWQFRILRCWSRMPNAFLFSYEDMTQNTSKCLEIIADRTGLSYDVMEDTRAKLSEDTSKIWQFNKGKANRYAEDLSRSEANKLNRIFAKQIDLVEKLRSESVL